MIVPRFSNGSIGMTRTTLAATAAVAFLVALTVTFAQTLPAIAVVSDPGCGCCLQWVDHLRQAGFKVTVTESDDIDAVKDSKGVPKNARSCHTATVGNYVLEGHVPAADIKKLLQTHPDIVGLAVPGMPSGSPGMEVPGGKKDPFDVVAFDKTGHTRVFASYR